MLPDVIIHNSISLDGSLTNFEPNMGLHYQIAGSYRADAHLIGSNTARIGIELYGEGVPPEEKKDFEKPKKDSNLPYWVIPDTKGTLQGLLHILRGFEFCRDVVVLISEETSEEYVKYLEESSYDHHVVGKKHVDLKRSLELLSEKYKVRTVLTDTGRILGNLLLEQGLVKEVSLLVHPVVVGKEAYNMFGNMQKGIKLNLVRNETLDNGYVWLVCRIES